MKHHNQVVDFQNLDFEVIDTEVLANDTKEKEGEAITAAIVGGGKEGHHCTFKATCTLQANLFSSFH